MFDEIQLDMSQAGEHGSFEPLPRGKYKLRASLIELKSTKDNSGLFLNCQIDVMEGQYEGRKFFISINIKNQSSQCVEIGLGELKSWFGCVFGEVPTTMTMPVIKQLEFKEFYAKVGIQKDKSGDYDDKNVIQRYLGTASENNGLQQAEQHRTGPGQAQGPGPGQAQGDTKRPWE